MFSSVQTTKNSTRISVAAQATQTFACDLNPSTTPSSNPGHLLTRQEAAAYIGVQPNTLATWACTQRYDLPYVKVGRNVRYRKQDLDAFIQRNLHGTSFNVIAVEAANV
ncbi:helix-turn-helix domain-containing protein [Cupriavidus campinensis]|uniref:Helix-turn-helix domain-containing protein n=1 Tax=Cupriavidus campinensis TaxID=151783 RepID=A0AAE9I2Y5_9BURK|nr:helix-turn-helix domain-containing protein [Cupriavidus campinensis]URF05062.1 helix-turn-helix domain-containing protein [Cupriavidus campinensis]